MAYTFNPKPQEAPCAPCQAGRATYSDYASKQIQQCSSHRLKGRLRKKGLALKASLGYTVRLFSVSENNQGQEHSPTQDHVLWVVHSGPQVSVLPREACPTQLLFYRIVKLFMGQLLGGARERPALHVPLYIIADRSPDQKTP